MQDFPVISELFKWLNVAGGVYAGYISLSAVPDIAPCWRKILVAATGIVALLLAGAYVDLIFHPHRLSIIGPYLRILVFFIMVLPALDIAARRHENADGLVTTILDNVKRAVETKDD